MWRPEDEASRCRALKNASPTWKAGWKTTRQRFTMCGPTSASYVPTWAGSSRSCAARCPVRSPDLRGETSGGFSALRSEMNRRFELVDARFIAMDQKIDRHFTWLVGLQVTSLLAILSAIAGLYLR